MQRGKAVRAVRSPCLLAAVFARHRPVDAELATITAKGQVTIPKAIREALGLRQGDRLRWDLEHDSVRVRVVPPLELRFLQGVEAGLQEWDSAADEEAFAGL